MRRAVEIPPPDCSMIRPTLCWLGGSNLTPSRRTTAFGRTCPLRGEGGKVWNRRVSPVAVRPGEGPLTERTAGVEPAQSERVFMPQRRPWPGPRESIGQSGKQSFDRAASSLSHHVTTAKTARHIGLSPRPCSAIFSRLPVRRFGAKPDKNFVDVQAASPSSWKTPCMARLMVW